MAGWGAPGSPAQGGGLPLDALAFSYDSYGNPVTEQGYDVYVSGAAWTPYGEISQVQLGTGPSAAALTYSYDPQTRNVTGISLSDSQPSPQVDDTTYSYNADRQVTKITDTQGAPGSATETQCFGYDGLSRLTQAWTSSDACAVNPASGGNATVAGPQPYWQSWTFGAAGDITSRTDHATAGSSSGTDTTTYSYGAAGHAHAVARTSTVNSATGATTTTGFSYDSDGQATTLGSQSLTWNPGGTLKSAGSTSYIYDADGNELVEKGPSGTTLYLPGEQLTESGSGTVSGIRYYSFAGEIIGEGTGASLWWTEENTQGTLTAAVNAGNEAAVAIRRTLTPYGTPITGSGGGTWPDNRTFLNDSYHSSTGLVDIGARKYDPATGTFISVDPVLDTSNPQTMNGYVYGAGDPVNNTDPTGEMLMIDAGGGFVGSAAAIEHMYAMRQQEERAAYNRLANQIENRQLENCYCHMSTMEAIVREYHNPVYVQQRVSQYNATAAYDARVLQQAEIERQREAAQAQENSGGGCGFLGLSCVGRLVVHHWRGIAQVATFAACLTPGVLLCLGAMAADTLATSAADANQHGHWNWGVFGKEALIGGAMDLASAGLGFGAGKLLDKGIEKFGLEAAEGSSTRGVIGKVFGAYGPKYVAQHAAGVGRHAAPMFHLDPIPTLVQVGSRAGLGELTCGGSSLDYCP